MLIDSTSPIDLPLYNTLWVSLLKRAPLQISHGTFTSGRKLISIRVRPWPSQPAQRPAPTLNEKRLAVNPRIRASVASANIRLILSQKPI